LGQIFVARVRLGWVSHLWFGFRFGKFPLKIKIKIIFFPFDQKIGSNSTQIKGGWVPLGGPSLKQGDIYSIWFFHFKLRIKQQLKKYLPFFVTYHSFFKANQNIHFISSQKVIQYKVIQ